MCKFPSCNVTRDKRVLWHKDIHSHSKLSQLFKVNDDKVAKYEWNLKSSSLIIDREPSWIRQSYRDIAERHFQKHYGTPEALIGSIKKLNPEEFERFWDLYELLNGSVQQKLPSCPYSYPCPYPCPSPCPYPCPYPSPYPRLYPCQCLTKRQYRNWTRAWKKEWIRLYSNPRNRL